MPRCGRTFDTFVDTFDGGQGMSIRCYRDAATVVPISFPEGYDWVELCIEHIREAEDHHVTPEHDCTEAPTYPERCPACVVEASRGTLTVSPEPPVEG